MAQLGDRRVWGAARTRQHRTLVYIIKRVPRVSLVHISGGFRIMHGAEANEGHDEEEYPWLKMVPFCIEIFLTYHFAIFKIL